MGKGKIKSLVFIPFFLLSLFPLVTLHSANILLLVISQPEVWTAIVKGAARSTFIVLLTGLFTLTILLYVYIIYREQTIKKLRRQLIADEKLKSVGRVVAHLSHEISNDR